MLSHEVHGQEYRRRMAVFRVIIIFLGILLSRTVLAETVIGLSGGPTWSSGNETQTLDLQPDITKTYTADNSNSVFQNLEFFVAKQKPLNTTLMGQPLISQLGLSIAEAGNAKLRGDIWEDADPNFDNFTYNYKVNHAHLAIKGRLISHTNFIFDPYISGSMGVGFNHAYNFTITPKISEEVAAPPFNSNTNTTFSYTLGIGLQKSLSKQIQIALGYEFADWGKVSLSPAAGQTTSSGLTLNHLYAQSLQFSLFYIV